MIGQGGMGVVFQAADTKLDRNVALKVLPAEMASNPERLARFKREAKAVAALNHSPGWLRVEPTFDLLRRNPRFERLTRE